MASGDYSGVHRDEPWKEQHLNDFLDKIPIRKPEDFSAVTEALKSITEPALLCHVL